MSRPLLCEFGHRDGPQGKIYCDKSGIVCAHQYWCDMGVEYRHHPEAARCPGREEEGGKKHETAAE